MRLCGTRGVEKGPSRLAISGRVCVREGHALAPAVANPAGFLLAAGEKELSNSIRPAPCDSKYNCDPEDDARLLKPAELGHATTNPYFE